MGLSSMIARLRKLLKIRFQKPDSEDDQKNLQGGNGDKSEKEVDVIGRHEHEKRTINQAQNLWHSRTGPELPSGPDTHLSGEGLKVFGTYRPALSEAPLEWYLRGRRRRARRPPRMAKTKGKLFSNISKWTSARSSPGPSFLES